MLTRPAISDEQISSRVCASFGLRATGVSFLPIGDVNSAAFRVTADDGAAYFLKLRGRPVPAVAVAVPAFLHRQGIPGILAPIAARTRRWWLRADGYGPVAVDPVALAYYRYERIVIDVAEYGNQIFGQQGSVEDRERGLEKLMAAFGPGDVGEIAHRSFPG
jgi:hypothetical protein